MIDDKELKQILKKYNYIITISETEKGCQVLLPSAIINFSYDANIYNFTIKEGNTSDESGILYETYSSGSVFIPISRFAIYQVILSNIDVLCISYSYSVSLLNFIDINGNEVENLRLSDKIKLNENEIKLKNNLERLVEIGLNEGFSEDLEKMADEHGVLESFLIIKSIYEGVNDE